MLKVDENPVKATGFGNLWDLHRPQAADVKAGSDGTLLQASFYGVFDDRDEDALSRKETQKANGRITDMVRGPGGNSKPLTRLK